MTWKRPIGIIHSEDTKKCGGGMSSPRSPQGRSGGPTIYVAETPELAEETVQKNRCGEVVAGNFCEKYQFYRFETSRTGAE